MLNPAILLKGQCFLWGVKERDHEIDRLRSKNCWVLSDED